MTIVISALVQLLGWLWWLQVIFKNKSKIAAVLSLQSKWLLLLSSVALSIKLILQLGSTIPSISTLAFGYRPIVIAYLHLILLGVITLFLLGYLTGEKLLPANAKVRNGILVFTSAIIFNELLLMVQGAAAIQYTMVPFINEWLLLAGGLLFTGMLLLNLGIKKQN